MKSRSANNKTSRGVEIEDYLLTSTEKEAAKLERPISRKPLAVFWWAVIIFLLVLGGRIFYLNVVRGEYYQEMAKGNKIRSVVIKAPRGKIIDRSGILLVNNVPSVNAVIVPADLPADREKIKQAAQELSQILNLNEGEIMTKLSISDKRSLNPVLLKENISHDESIAIMEKKKDLPGIMLEKSAIRDYTDGLIFSHILGYEGKIEKEELEKNPDYLMTDYMGKYGIEKSYEKYLRGTHGALQVEVDSLGMVKRELGIINPEPGNDLVLTIDARLQKKIFDSLSAMLEKTETEMAAAVAINPQNGEVLALVSLPSFDNNLFARGVSRENFLTLLNDPSYPFFNRAIAGEYPPGSALKPLVAAAALAEGTINESATVNCPGSIGVGNYTFGDWKTHGPTDIRKAIAESCDVFFYAIGGGWANIEGLGISRMKKYENLFGLGEATGIDIPGEAKGFIPDEEWKLEKFGERWYVGNDYHAAIGQGFVTATPLQLANAISAIANGGTLFKPRLVSQIKRAENQELVLKPDIVRSGFVPAEAIKVVQEGMRQTTTSGTAQSLSGLPVAVAGKTGTAQFGSENKTHAWFASYAPYENPEIAMIVLVEGGGEGHSSAVPVTQEIYQWYFSER